ncbi:ArfGap-domain-containing protein [Microstroma glucosiphilum]|uniref:ArfGap-domain-containing protein n=1 Tax=Pseudomicrostroma glucosiphilum TaxID=1684307 RepID=A0A316U6C9_9BASI|nr:ArfGap-domain-containing protein [Pseudomicrostroma glucosiphilum]PWN20779.1 ArfGap-domain-containing protein [Pseudomicrostroma glucosiphilum]
MNAKAAASRYQRQVAEISRLPGNEVCADCRGRNPRWASHNLGIFLCVQCAGVHRKMGTHISKVKSLTLDEWTKEQVERMREYGNEKSNAYYNPDEKRNRPPANVGDGERDSEVERFIRNKYEFRKFIDRKPPPVPIKDASGSDSSRRPGYTSRTASSSSTSGAGGGWGAASRLSPVDMRSGRTSPPRGSDPSNSASGRDIHRSRTAPIPTSWKEAQRAVSPLPPLAGSSQQTTTSTTPAISVSSARSAALPSSAGQPSSSSTYLSSTYQPSTNGLSAVNGGAPGHLQRASSAQNLTSNGGSAFPTSSQAFNGQASSGAAPAASSSFQGRSAVFDDLLQLASPAPPTQQASSFGGVGNPWGGMQPAATGVTMNGMQGNGMNGMGAGMNPWAQQQQQQTQYSQMNGMLNQPTGMAYSSPAAGSYFQQPGGGQQSGHLTPQNLGSMAFSPQIQQQQQHQQAYFQPQAQSQPFSSSFGTTPAGSGNPFGSSAPNFSSGFQQQQQQAPPVQMGFQPGQQPLQPQDTVQMMGEQRLQNGQVFQDWTSRMMPSSQQQQQGQQGGGGWR